MATLKLNKADSFSKNAVATVTECIFLIQGSSADALVYTANGQNLIGEKKNISPGNIAKINGLNIGTQYKYQINPKDSKLGNATVTY
ncbi:hypothetical protein [Tenacibaculum sp. 190524A02b]|uniref:hypothetical protein n=1 Tax=Tenacibaculum vairaonense TaxID=3137860 RepID=UPI0031FB19A8